MSTDRKQLGKYILDRLQDYGADHIFTVPGDYLLGFNKACESHPLIQINGTRENTAAFMADAYARVKGIAAVAITYGVGVNVASALSQAYAERTPLVMISASPNPELRANKYLHHTTRPGHNAQLEIFRPVTVAQAVIEDLSDAASKIESALEACVRERRPVYIEVSQDLISMDIEIPPPHLSSSIKVDETALEEALLEVQTMLSMAKKPVIWAGAGVTNYRLNDPLLQFAEKHQIPICSSRQGKTVISERHPLFMGAYQGELGAEKVKDYIHSSDCILILGVLPSDLNTGMFTAQIVEEKPCIVANAEELTIRAHSYKNIPFRSFIQRLALVEGVPRFDPQLPQYKGLYEGDFSARPSTALTTDRMFSCIQQLLPKDCIVATGVGDSFFATSELVLEQQSFVSCAFFMSLGYCVPAAIGTALATPDRRVVAIVGDGDFQMTGVEFGTAARFGVDPIVIVLNNQGYGIERPLLEGEYNDISNWKYHLIPELVGGGKGSLAREEEEFEHQLKSALEERGTAHLIEAQVDKMDFSTPLKHFTNFYNKCRERK